MAVREYKLHQDLEDLGQTIHGANDSTERNSNLPFFNVFVTTLRSGWR